MEHSLRDNIRTLRKKRGLTQEQLAEAMGVTAGAVSKWEKGQSAPELGLLMELADFFDLSVDALVGFAPRSNNREQTAKQIETFRREKRLLEGVAEAEKAMQKYPNDFRIVYESATLYQVAGIQSKETEKLRRALALMEKACLLIKQNTDETISELKMQIDMAHTHLAMGDRKTGLRLLKKHNPCGISDDVIGLELSADAEGADEALSFLSEALITSMNALARTALGFANVFMRREQYGEAADILRWAAETIRGLRQPGKTSYLDKLEATLMLACAHTLLKESKREEAEACLQAALKTALRFDTAPDYSTSSVRFCEQMRPGTAFDNIGATAMEGLGNIVKECDDAAMTALWEDMSREKS